MPAASPASRHNSELTLTLPQDISIALGGDGYYYLTGTSVWAGDNYWSDSWGVIRMWRSPTLTPGSFVGGGVVYNNSRRCQRIWAPEIHYIPQRATLGSYFISVDCGDECSAGHILRSTTGTGFGPYETLVAGIPGGDVSIFYDDATDGVYAISSAGGPRGLIATPIMRNKIGSSPDPFDAGVHSLQMAACTASAGEDWWLHNFGLRSPQSIELGHNGNTALCIDTSAGKTFKVFSCGAGGTRGCDNQQLEYRASDMSIRWHCGANTFCLSQTGTSSTAPVLVPCRNDSVTTEPASQWEWTAPTSAASSSPIVNRQSMLCLQVQPNLQSSFRLDTGGGCQGDCSHSDIGFEGPFMLKVNGSYFISASAFGNASLHGGPQSAGFTLSSCSNCWYSAFMGKSHSLRGAFTQTGQGRPDGGWLAVPSGGHNAYFRTKEGELWATIWFGSNPHNDTPASKQPFIDLPSIVKVEIAADGRLVSVGHAPFGSGRPLV